MKFLEHYPVGSCLLQNNKNFRTFLTFFFIKQLWTYVCAVRNVFYMPQDDFPFTIPSPRHNLLYIRGL